MLSQEHRRMPTDRYRTNAELVVREKVYGKAARVLAEQRASNELVKLIRKLRWMGLEEEAKRIADELTLRRAAAGAESVVAAPRETD
jgi:hypothetical protein